MNPLYKQNKQVQPNLAEVKERLKKQDDAFYQRMIQIAKQRGIPESAIREGMEYINTLRH